MMKNRYFALSLVGGIKEINLIGMLSASYVLRLMIFCFRIFMIKKLSRAKSDTKLQKD